MDRTKIVAIGIVIILIAAIGFIAINTNEEPSVPSVDDVPMEGNTDQAVNVPNITLNSNSLLEYNLYPGSVASPNGTTYTYVIPNTTNYTGTINLGITEDGTFVSNHSVKLTEVGSAIITIHVKWTFEKVSDEESGETSDETELKITDDSITIETYNTDVIADANKLITTGTIEVLKGDVTFGVEKTNPEDSKYFTGTSNGIKIVNILDLTITNKDNNINISGTTLGGGQVGIPLPELSESPSSEEPQPTKTVKSTITTTKSITTDNFSRGGVFVPEISSSSLYSIDTTVEHVVA